MNEDERESRERGEGPARLDLRHGHVQAEPPMPIEAGSGCLLCTEAFEAVYSIGDKICYRGRILYCDGLGAWIDQGPADPTPGTGSGRALVC